MPPLLITSNKKQTLLLVDVILEAAVAVSAVITPGVTAAVVVLVTAASSDVGTHAPKGDGSPHTGGFKETRTWEMKPWFGFHALGSSFTNNQK